MNIVASFSLATARTRCAVVASISNRTEPPRNDCSGRLGRSVISASSVGWLES